MRVPVELACGKAIAASQAIFSREIFRFFRELAANNRKTWMDANRERYGTVVVDTFRALLDCLAPAAWTTILPASTATFVLPSISLPDRSSEVSDDLLGRRTQCPPSLSHAFRNVRKDQFPGPRKNFLTR